MKRALLFCLFLIPLLLSLVLDLLLSPGAAADFSVRWWHTLLTRSLCGLSALSLLLSRGTSPLCPIARPTAPRPLCVTVILLSFLVALNNLPVSPLLSGRAQVTAAPGELILFALGCLSIGFFEEVLFRGLLFLALFRRIGRSARGRVAAILLSSAAFGLLHLVNLAAGAGLAPTLLQVGYSFLIGCLTAVLLLATGSLLPPILCHALYDFTGRLVPECGSGSLWDTPTTILTTTLALLTVAACIAFLCADRPSISPNQAHENCENR